MAGNNDRLGGQQPQDGTNPPSDPMAASRLQDAIAAARLGGEVLMRYFRDGVQMRDKSAGGGKAYDLVSDADLESEQVIGRYLQQRYPGEELLGEEDLAGDVEAERLWIIDPLDGTNNFAHQLPHFAVSIAYYHAGEPLVGVVFNPAHDEIYSATRGGGAFCNGSRIRVSPAASLGETLIGCGFYYDRGAMMRRTLEAIEEFFANEVHGIRRFGGAALDLCHVARGQFGGFFEYQLSPWDFAAGALIVREAGGQVSEARGGSLRLETSSVAASNGRLHESIIAITSRHHP